MLAAEKCVNVVGYEFFGEQQQMDPAAIMGTDDSYHIEAIYEGLVDGMVVDDEDGDKSYIFNMSILDIDLDEVS